MESQPTSLSIKRELETEEEDSSKRAKATDIAEGSSTVEEQKTESKPSELVDIAAISGQDNDDEEGPNKFPKRKVALRIAYVGKKYFGMQLNPGTETIESELQRAMVECGALLVANAEQLSKVQFVRAARTDKGVHAAGQIVSMKLLMIPDVMEAINKALPAQIRILGIKRVIGSFHAKNNCDSRIYEYFMPTYMFMPGNANKYFDTKHPDLFPDAVKAPTIAEEPPSINESESSASKPNSSRKRKGKADDEEGDDNDDFDDGTDQRRVWLQKLEFTRSPEDIRKEKEDRLNFRLSPAQLSKLRHTLSLYKGTHNFHNYTSGKKPSDASASRYILWFKAEEPIIFGGHEWIALRVQGQSFMLHQIRKMVGMAVGLMRVDGDENIVIPQTFQNKRVNIPRAPGAGLFLDEVRYEQYNQKLKRLGNPQEPLDWSDIQAEVDEFKRKYIYASITDDEHRGAFLEFLRCIDFYDNDYAYVRAKATATTANTSTTTAITTTTTSLPVKVDEQPQVESSDASSLTVVT